MNKKQGDHISTSREKYIEKGYRKRNNGIRSKRMEFKFVYMCVYYFIQSKDKVELVKIEILGIRISYQV